mgnify:CR=1 FL=1
MSIQKVIPRSIKCDSKPPIVAVNSATIGPRKRIKTVLLILILQSL